MFGFRTLVLALAGAAAATNTVQFVSTDSVGRTIYFTPSSGPEMDPVTVPAGQTVSVTFADGYIGNAYAVKDGATATAGMLAEFTFQGWNDLTYFDVSAIVDPSDTDNIKTIYPANSPNTPVSGCTSFPCNNAYYHPDDIQTKSSDQTEFIVTLGSGSSSKRDVNGLADTGKNFPRNLVERRY